LLIALCCALHRYGNQVQEEKKDAFYKNNHKKHNTSHLFDHLVNYYILIISHLFQFLSLFLDFFWA